MDDRDRGTLPDDRPASASAMYGRPTGAVGERFDDGVRAVVGGCFEQCPTLAKLLFGYAREGVLVTDGEGVVVDCNDAFTQVMGHAREEILGRHARTLISGLHGTELFAAIWRELTEKDHWRGEAWSRSKDGRLFPVTLIMTAVRDPEGARQHFLGLVSDLSGQEDQRRHLDYIAHYDPLTGLPNRILLVDRLQRAMEQVACRGTRLTVAYLDLDGFKAINDTYGHEAGDRLLVALARRMPSALRACDTIARLGGDEFVAVLLDLDDSIGEVVLERLRMAASDPVLLGDVVLQVSVSIGVTHYPQAREVDADQLLRQSDQAMYQAKLAGRNSDQLFDPEQAFNLMDRHQCLARIRTALERREFVLYYQPKANMHTGEIFGAEALIRWQHPERGLLLPNAFLPPIEGHAVAVELGEWVIETALTQLEEWHAVGLHISVSVNLGAYQLQRPDFMDCLRTLLAAHPRVHPSFLELEIVESSALQDIELVAQVIDACREIGVQFALDDFGTGYSSLTYLKRLPAASLKIDQTFVRDMLDDPDDLSILEGVLGLAKAFERHAIAEGVETVEHGRLLLQLGCELAQGYGIAVPMPGADLLRWVSAWRPPVVWSTESRVAREDLPVIFAQVEHRAWLRKLEDVVLYGRMLPPPMHVRHCRFGRWLYGEGRVRYGDRPSFERVEIQHRQIHEYANEILDLKWQGREDQAIARLNTLYEARDSLSEALLSLVSTRPR